jgi:hypothetical protein
MLVTVLLIPGIMSVTFCLICSVHGSMCVLSAIGSYIAILLLLGIVIVVSVGLQIQYTAVLPVFVIKQ